MSEPSGPARVTILLAVHQGAAFLPAQLDSFVAQTGVDWSLIISDDSPGPDDGTGAILRAFQAAHPARDITLCRGPRHGFAANFLTLLQAVPPGVAHVAFSDQDDVWLPDKLSRAVAALQDVPGARPALYCARTMVVDRELRAHGLSPGFGRAPAFENALVQSIGGGNTMMLNRPGLDLARDAAAEVLRGPGTVVAHDWWLYQMITGCGGVVLRDPVPALLYRQHGGNMIGANRSFRERIGRASAVMGGRLQRWNRINMAALAVSARHFEPEAQRVLAQYRAAREGPPHRRLAALAASGVWRQHRLDTAALYLACLLGRL